MRKPFKTTTLLIALFLALSPILWASSQDVILANVQVNDVAFSQGLFFIATSEGLYAYDSKFKKQIMFKKIEFAHHLIVVDNKMFIASADGLYLYFNNNLRRVNLPVQHKYPGDTYIKTMCLYKFQGKPHLLISMEDASSEDIDPLGLFDYDIESKRATKFTHLEDSEKLNISAITSHNTMLYLGLDDDNSSMPGAVIALDLLNMKAEVIIPSEKPFAGEVSYLEKTDKVLFVARYWGAADGQNALAAFDGKFEVPILKTKANDLSGISMITSFNDGYLIGAIVDDPSSRSPRLYYMDSNLKTRAISSIKPTSQILNIKYINGHWFFCLRNGLLVFDKIVTEKME